METSTGPRSLIACMGHAVYQTREESTDRKDKREWVGGYKGEEALYFGHVKTACDLGRLGKYDCVVLSGGRTRIKADKVEDRINKSEARGMLDLGLDQKPPWFVKRDDGLYYVADTEHNTRVLLEEYARDSYENLLFSVLAFQLEFGEWPKGVVGVVSFQFKLLRYGIAAAALNLHDFAFHGGDVPFGTLKKCAGEEADYVEKALRDPLHRGVEFATKRLKRTPSDKNYGQYWRDVTDHYSNQGALGLVKQYLDELEALESPPAEPDVPWRHDEWKVTPGSPVVGA